MAGPRQDQLNINSRPIMSIIQDLPSFVFCFFFRARENPQFRLEAWRELE